MNAFSQDPQEVEDLTQAMEQLTEAMGRDGRDRLMTEGSLMNLDDAVQLTLIEKP